MSVYFYIYDINPEYTNNMSNPEQILRKLLGEIIENKNYKDPKLNLEQISTGGANYTSQLFIVTVSEPGNEDLQLFAKVGIVGEKMRSQMPVLIYDIERYAYKELLGKYESIQNDHQVPAAERLRIPKFYGYNPTVYEETIVLENLAAKGFTTYDRFKSINWEYASKSVTSMAKFHALSIVYSEEYPEEYKRVLDMMKFQVDAISIFIREGLKKYQNIAIAAASENNKSKLKNYLESKVSLDVIVNFYKPGRLHILCHGDYRPSNLMHRENKDGTMEVIPVDYQTIHTGTPLTDLIYFIFTGSDEEFRRRHFWDLLDYYYRELCNALRSLGRNPRNVYPEDEFHHDVKEILPLGLVIGIILLPVITVETEDAPALDGEIDLDTVLNTKISSSYVERMRGIINDYARWDII
ncbi:uncharacterized oxidoreductase dhs-27-like [Galleria mellonella]|uniref:Uncharacterized oxidoreductase dhs-27-like n=1 Tax=Galleria mellonella TaxID=7137 RepID=A0A6J1WTK8_GALME|nr:uncharacterized oxidoreductase dhs-27-like [Galleria mellonella]